MNDKGFPAKMAAGVYEVNDALQAWGAPVKEDAKE